MSNWRDQILLEFTPKVARLTLVADPDGLLLEEGIVHSLHERGFELLPFDDHIAFRYAYESKFRSRWDREEHTELVVVSRSQASDLSGLPYDLLQAGRRLSFDLGDIFPNLSYPVVNALDRGDLEGLYEAQKRHAPGQLGDNATKEFVLRHVFEIAPELVKQPSDLLRVLLRRHYREQRIPTDLDGRFIQLLRQSIVFDDWPLETLVSDREAFFTFLQERWPIFLDREAGRATIGDPAEAPTQSDVCDDRKPHVFAIEGPIDLPFDHHDIRFYIGNLFKDGLLQSVSHVHATILSTTWVGFGVRSVTAEDRSRGLSLRLSSLETSIPADDARHLEWFRFARGWAEIKVASHQEGGLTSEQQEKLAELTHEVDERFLRWVMRCYARHIQLPPNQPVMLHHLPGFLAYSLDPSAHSASQPLTKVALLVVDGLSMDQWLVIRGALVSQKPSLRLSEQAVLAWIPTLTSVSRQAAFAGKTPFYFPNSIETTKQEKTLWEMFWTDKGYTADQVAYVKGLGDGSLESVAELLARPQVRIAGLVVDKIDRIMHGMEMGTAGMHNQVGLWARQPYLVELLDLLLDYGFRIYLTSDHGNVEATGCGSPKEGDVADYRGQRVRVYRYASLRRQVSERFPAAIEWDTIGLPENYFALLAPPRKAFIQETQRCVSHGGISLEELIVPLVQIERRGE